VINPKDKIGTIDREAIDSKNLSPKVIDLKD
jgi:hypothetical protein